MFFWSASKVFFLTSDVLALQNCAPTLFPGLIISQESYGSHYGFLHNNRSLLRSAARGKAGLFFSAVI